ncbi:MAG: hypothetical protein AAGN82_17475 [Myxococcota bacterium]
MCEAYGADVEATSRGTERHMELRAWIHSWVERSKHHYRIEQHLDDATRTLLDLLSNPPRFADLDLIIALGQTFDANDPHGPISDVIRLPEVVSVLVDRVDLPDDGQRKDVMYALSFLVPEKLLQPHAKRLVEASMRSRSDQVDVGLILGRLGTPKARTVWRAGTWTFSSARRELAVRARFGEAGAVDALIADLESILSAGREKPSHTEKWSEAIELVLLLGYVGSPRAVASLARHARAAETYYDGRWQREIRASVFLALGRAFPRQAPLIFRRPTSQADIDRMERWLGFCLGTTWTEMSPPFRPMVGVHPQVSP